MWVRSPAGEKSSYFILCYTFFLLQDNEYVEFLIKGKKQTSITVVVVVGYTDDIFHFGQAPYSDKQFQRDILTSASGQTHTLNGSTVDSQPVCSGYFYMTKLTQR